MPYIRDEITYSCRYTDRMKEHPNILMKNLVRNIKIPRRLKRRLPTKHIYLIGATL